MSKRMGDCLRTFASFCARALHRGRRVATWALAALVMAAVATPLHAQAGLIPAGLPLSQDAEGRATGTAQIVGSILSYTRWPKMPNPVRLCVIGPARHDGQLSGKLPGGVAVSRRELPALSPEIATACDALYIGEIAQSAVRAAVGAVRGRPTLTIAENDPTCRGGAMFCLRFGRELSFALNIDAITRSAIRVDPRVLRISRGY